MVAGEIVAVCISKEREQLKEEIPEGRFIENFGIENDGHGGDWDRQVSLLAAEDIQWAVEKYDLKVKPGDFAENIITKDINLASLPIGARIRVGAEAILEITQFGKEAHESVVTRTLGVSLIPDVGIFARVVKGGPVRAGDAIEVLEGV